MEKCKRIAGRLDPKKQRKNPLLRHIMLCFALLGLCWTPAQAAEPLALNPDAPSTYIVKTGDTLWDLAGVFLESPWRWPELWAENPEIDDPHWIYPGDQLRLVWEGDNPRLVKHPRSTIRLSPTMRPDHLESAIPTIPTEQIEPFLRRYGVMSATFLAQAAHVVAGDSGRLITGLGDTLYAHLGQDDSSHYQVVRPVQSLTDPTTGESLGVFVEVVAEARVSGAASAMHPSSLVVTRAYQEVRLGDRLMPLQRDTPQNDYSFQIPQLTIADARIIAVANGITQVGALDIVVINRGERDALREGDLLAIHQQGQEVKDPLTENWVRLPAVEAGVLAVFSVFERASFGLVLEARGPLAVGDSLASL